VAILIQTNLGEEGITYHPPSDDDEDDGDELSDGNKQKKELDRSIFGHFVGKIRKYVYEEKMNITSLKNKILKTT
jgi:hypothetical protein